MKNGERAILGVVGSPRRNGNTHILVSRVLDGAGEAGALTALVFLGDLTIVECDGCHVCWRGKPCSKCDGMNDLYPRISDSDVLVFGTPVYWYGPTALMKAFLDRFVYFNCPENREKIRDKVAILAIPFEEDNPETAAPLVDMFRKSFRYMELQLAGTLLAPGVGEKGDILRKAEVLERAFELGKNVAAFLCPFAFFARNFFSCLLYTSPSPRD